MRTALAACLGLLLSAGPRALAADVDDCNSGVPHAQLSGCTALVKKGSLNNSELALAYSRRSDAYLAQGSVGPAIDDRKEAVRLEPANNQNKQRLSEAYRLRAMGARLQVEQALSDFSEAIKFDPTDHVSHFHRGMLHASAERFDSAIKDLTAAISMEPREPRYKSVISGVYELSGIERLARGEVDQAIEAFTFAINSDARRAGLYFNRGIAHERRGTVEKALLDFSEAIRLNNDLVEAYLRRSQLVYSLGGHARAIEDVDEVLKRDPRNVLALMWRGLVREQAGKGELADYGLSGSLENCPNHKEATEALKRLVVLDTSGPGHREGARPVRRQAERRRGYADQGGPEGLEGCWL